MMKIKCRPIYNLVLATFLFFYKYSFIFRRTKMEGDCGREDEEAVVSFGPELTNLSILKQSKSLN